MVKIEDLNRMEEVLELTLKVWKRDYHWKNEAEFNKEFGLGFMCSNLDKLKEIISLAKIGLLVSPHLELTLDLLTKALYNESSVGENHVDLQRQRTKERDAGEGRPDEGVSATLR